jgi:transglutaminase-like putative cysteine protease
MNYSFKITLACISILFCCLKNYSQKGLPRWASLEDIHSISEINAKEIKDGYYYILAEEQYNTVEEQNLFHFATRVSSEAGLSEASQIEFSYDPSFQSASIHFIKIYRGSQTIDKTSTSDVKILNEEKNRSNGLLYGKRTLYVNLTDVRKGDLIEYCYSIRGYNKLYKGSFNKDFWFAYSVPIGRIKYKLFVLPETEPNFVYKSCDAKPVITKGKLKEYVWRVNTPSVITKENDTPSWYDPYPQMQVSTFKHWSDVKSWFETLFNLSTYNQSGLQSVADSIRKEFPDNTEKQITACVAFVQDHIRYLGNENGIYSHVPHSPDYVLKNRFGDCKDKSLLLVELLRLFEVTSYPALLNTSLQSTIKDQSPSAHRFDHCIVAIAYKNNLKFIDPTALYQAGVFSMRSLPNYETAMLLDHTSSIFTDIPTDLSSKMEMEEIFNIDELGGDATLKAIFKYSGSKAEDIRYYFETKSYAEIQEIFKSVYEPYAEEIAIIDSLSMEDDKINNTVTTYEYYTLKKFWVRKEGDNGVIVKNFTPYSLNEKVSYAMDQSRKDPFNIQYPVYMHQKITVTKDGGFLSNKNAFKESNPFFDYFFNMSSEGKVLELDYTFVSKTGTVKPEDYALYKTKTDFVSDNMVYYTSQKFLDKTADTFNWLLFTVIILAGIASTFICIHLYHKNFKTHYFVKYDSIGGWLILIGIGIAIGPLFLISQLAKLYMDEFSTSYYDFYFKEDSLFYEPLQGYFVLSVVILNVFLVALNVLLAFTFFKRKNSFRIYYPVFKIYNLILLIFILVMNINFFYNMNDEATQKDVSKQQADIFRVFIQSCFLIPYVLYSERSKHTFTNTDSTEESVVLDLENEGEPSNEEPTT